MADVNWKEKQNEAGDEVLLLSKTTSSASSTAKTSALKATVSVVLGCLIGLLFVQLCIRSAFSEPPALEDADAFKVSMQFRGTDDVDIEQHVTSAVSANYVMYHVIKPYETTWIVDDFERSLQIMKIETPVDSICYVTHLNRSHAASPGEYGEQFGAITGDKKRIQTTFYADEMQLDDLSHLGTRALKLCFNTPTFWIYPLSDKASSAAVDTQPDIYSRQKRNVKKCMTSCCILVCCCNQRYLQFQYAEKINCHNICHGCTPAAKMTTVHVC